MNGIYIIYEKFDNNKLSGIDKKIRLQNKLFNLDKNKCEFYVMHTKLNTIFDKIKFRLPFSNVAPCWKYDDEFKYIDFLYFRRPSCITLKMLLFLKKVRNENKKIKIVMEIPTYPYDYETKIQKKNIPLYIKDKINRRYLFKYIDRIAVQNKIDIIWGIPTLYFKNGIDVDEILKSSYEGEYNKIQLCLVASMTPWQGYERVILSLNKYYKNGGKRDIILHFIGVGSELEKYKKLVNECKLDAHAVFHGFLTGENLDKIYNKCDIGVDAFGRYKTCNELSTSLKSREYLCKGLPIISGSKVDVFEKTNEFYLEFPSDDSLFLFETVIDFYDKIYGNNTHDEVADKLRSYAKENYDYVKTMKELKDYISV